MTAGGAPADRRGDLTMYAYPWDLDLDGVEQSVGLVADLGCTRMAVAVAYHSASLLAPRRERPVQFDIEPNVAHFPLRACFSDLALPEGRLAREAPELGTELAKAAGVAGIGLTAWTIVCHNSDLARSRPDLALESCFGDRSTHGLCPSNPAVRRYAVELCGAVLGLGIFDELFVESVAYLLAGHGHPHELWAVRDDPSLRYLRSLCFCEHCIRLGTKLGIDAAALRSFVAGALRRAWSSPLAAGRDPDPGDELAGLLVARPDLATWTRLRCVRVAELIAELAELAHANGARLASALGVWARPTPLGFMEGIDPPMLAERSDRLVAMAYYPTPGAVARDLDYLLMTIDAERLQLAQTLWPSHHAALEVLLAKIELARRAGVRDFGLYNLSTVPAFALPWARAVADLVSR